MWLVLPFLLSKIKVNYKIIRGPDTREDNDGIKQKHIKSEIWYMYVYPFKLKINNKNYEKVEF